MGGYFEKGSHEFQKLEKWVGTPEALAAPVSAERLRELCAGDEVLEDLLSDFLTSAERYTEQVVHHELSALRFDPDAAERYDENRRRAHEGLIARLDPLVRNLAARGRETAWAASLTDREAKGVLGMQLTYLTLIEEFRRREQ